MRDILKKIVPYKEEPDFLSNWVKLSKHLLTLNSEEELLKVLKTEIISKQRVDVIQRIYSRYNRIRMKREFKEILVDIIDQP